MTHPASSCTTQTRARHGLAATAAFAAVATMATTTEAASGPLEQDHFHEAWSEVVDGYCGDLSVQIDNVLDGSFLLNPHGSDGLAYGSAHIHGSQTITNLANSKTLTLVFDYVDKDQKVTDNGDGTLTIRVARPGRQVVYGPDGQKLFMDAGTVWFEVLVDHGGTPVDPSDDHVLESLGIVKHVGQQDTAGRDFCADLHEYIGGPGESG